MTARIPTIQVSVDGIRKRQGRLDPLQVQSSSKRGESLYCEVALENPSVSRGDDDEIRVGPAGRKADQDM